VVFSLSKDFLLIHLRMSGDLRVEQEKNERGIVVDPQKHDRAILYFSDNVRLHFNDPRKFGRMWLCAQQEEVLGNLGPEPLDPALNAEDFYRLLQKHHKILKPLLMDQTFLAGLGNIYTDEALFGARLHPMQLSNRINLRQSDLLLSSIREVLTEGIRRNGASIDWVYRGGSFQNNFKVYQKTGKACVVCGTEIQRILIGQRGTHFCPECQKVE
jgi:formamidopyrimidine-DNA glycosylase